MLQKIDQKIQYLRCFPALVSRLVLGFGFYLTGSGKLSHLDRFTTFLQSLGVPMASLQAPFVAGLEYVGGILLLLGLFTRPVSFLLSGTMVVALLTADKGRFWESWSPSSDIVPTDVTSFAYLIMLSWLFFYGAGFLSLDFLVVKRLWERRRSPAE